MTAVGADRPLDPRKFQDPSRTAAGEPRAHVAMTVNLLLPPTRPDADAAFIVLQADKAHPMSGSNCICVVTALLETGRDQHEAIAQLRHARSRFHEPALIQVVHPFFIGRKEQVRRRAAFDLARQRRARRIGRPHRRASPGVVDLEDVVQGISQAGGGEHGDALCQDWRRQHRRQVKLDWQRGAVDRRKVELEVARMHDDTDLGVKGQCVGARDRVGDGYELDPEGPDVAPLAVGAPLSPCSMPAPW